MASRGQELDTEALNSALGDLVAGLRRARGWSQARLADRSGLSIGVIRKVEWGGTACVNSYHAIAHALGARITMHIDRHVSVASGPDGRTGALAPWPAPQPLNGATSLAGDSDLWPYTVVPKVTTPEESSMNRRQFVMFTALAGLGLPDHVRQLFAAGKCPPLTEEEVRGIAELAEEHLLHQGATRGGGAVCDVAIAMHDKVQGWIHEGQQRRGVVDALDALAGDLGAWAGWLAIDSGRYDAAERYLQHTMTHARLSGAQLTELRALENLCLLYDVTGSHQRSLKAATTAICVADNWAPSRLLAILHMRKARAHARLGDANGFAEETGWAERELDRGTTGSEPGWTHFLTHSTFGSLTGLSALALGQSGEAADYLRPLADCPDPALPCESIYAQVILARAQLARGEVKEASALGLGALPAAWSVSSNMIDRELRSLRDGLRKAGGPEAWDFVGAYDAHLTAAT